MPPFPLREQPQKCPSWIGLRLLSAPARYIKRKVKSIYKKLVKKRPKETDSEVYNEEKLKRQSIDELKEIAKLRRIKNRFKLKKRL